MEAFLAPGGGAGDGGTMLPCPVISSRFVLAEPSNMPRLTDARYEENFPGAHYTDDEREFMLAMERYMRLKHRRFPSWHEVLAVLRTLGYRKQPIASAREPRPHSE